MGLGFLLALWMHAALDQSQWRILYQNGSIAAGWGDPGLVSAAAAPSKVRSIWAWSWVRAPLQVSLGRRARSFGANAGEGPFWLDVRVARRARGGGSSAARLLAAPVEMWRELPESDLPSWPVPASGRIAVPVDRTHSWRLRFVAGDEGSWWAEARPGQRSLLIPAIAARGIDVTVLRPDGRAAEGVHASIGEASARQGSSRIWALLVGASGRLEAGGLPDEQEVALTLMHPGSPPLVVRGWASTLPRRLILPMGAQLSGRVIDANRRPIAGAKIQAEAWAGQLPRLLRFGSESGADGSFALRALPAGRLSLTLRASGYVPQVEQLEIAAGETRDLGVRVLETGHSLMVEVRDEAGQAVPGAEVEAAPGIAATADGGGRAELAGVPLAPLDLTGTAPGHQPGSRRLQPPFPEPAVLTLRRGFTVRGRLLDSSGAPVAEGSVRIEAAGCSNDGSLRGDGSFEEDFQPGKEAQLVLRSPATRELRLPLAAGAPGEVRDLGDLSAPSGPEVTGSIASARSAQPVAGARVWLPRPGPQGPAAAWGLRDLIEARSGEDGRFRLVGLAPGPVTLRVEATGYARAMLDLVLPETAASGPAADVGTISLSSGTTVHVHVDLSRLGLDALAGAIARVDLRRRWLDADMLSAEVWNGEAQVPNVPPGSALVSVLAGPRVVCQKQIDVPADGGELDVDCAKSSLRVAGQVLVGGAAAGAGLLTWQSPGEAGYARIDTRVSPAGLQQQQVFAAGRPQVDVAVAPGGAFETSDLTPGAWRVFFQPQQGSATPALPVEIPDGERFDTVLPFAGSNLAGIVVTEDGHPAAGAIVRELASGAFAVAGAEGNFVLSGLAAGKAALEARLDELKSQIVAVELAPARTPDLVRLVVREREAPKVTVTLIDQAGLPVAGSFVFLEEEGKGMRLLTTGSDGTAAGGLEAPLPLRVRAAAFGKGVFALGDWTGREQSEQGITLQLAGSGGLLLRSAKRQGAVRIASQGGWDLSWMLRLLGASAEVTQAQPLRLDGLPPGLYRVTLDTSAVTVNVAEGELSEETVR